MNILVTGGAGYVGSVLLPELVKDEHSIKCLDRFFFGDEFLSQKQFDGKIELIKDDIRWFKPNILKDIDFVMDLAALSNDPVGALDPEKTYQINHLGRARVAKLCKDMGVKQYILASSASVYGQQKHTVDEKSVVNPITDYSKANRKAEEDVLKLNDENFCVTVLRFSSVYGSSPRMRFDISVNSMVLEMFRNHKIVVRGKNNSRPFIHIKDAVNAYQKVIVAPKEIISGQIFNVGSDEQNFKMGDIAENIIKATGQKCDLELGDTNDHRSYITSFKKIKDELGFRPSFSINDGANEIYNELCSGKLDSSNKTITLEWYKHIMSDQTLFNKLQINDQIL
ncbi:MAG: SDR family oxidoreductase [Nitrosopumilus sp.]|nr:SDR family oxidoreductase [Nitrosopumilus sp.]